MRNPLRNEAEAFRFLIITLAFFAAIVIARLLAGTIAALLVTIAGVAAIGWLLRGKPKAPDRPPRIVVRDAATEERSAVAPDAGRDSPS
jgi:hypothetical protein